jgi:hypothetical protein
MNSLFVRFVRPSICIGLALSLLTDPIAASGLSAAFTRPSAPASLQRIDPGWFNRQALIPRVAAAARMLPESLQTTQTREVMREAGQQSRAAEAFLSRRTILQTATAALIAIVPGSLWAQKRQPIERIQLPQAAEIRAQTVALSEAALRDAYHFNADISQAKRFEGLLGQVISGNPEVGEKFYSQRESLQILLGLIKDQGKYASVRTGEVGAALLGPQSKIDQILSFPGVSVSQPKSRVQTPDESEPGQKKGFLYWRSLARLAGRALQGVQFYSKNRVEASFLEEHRQMFRVRVAYAEYEEAVAQNFEKAARAWLAYATQARGLEELRHQAWIDQRAFDRERRAVAREGGSPDNVYRLRRASLASRQAYEQAEQALRSNQIDVVAAIASDEKVLSSAAADALKPEGPSWRLPPPPSIATLESAAAELRRTSFVPADFLPNGRHPEGFPVTAQDLKAVLMEFPVDLPLGTSPVERRLMLQKEMLDAIDIPALKLRKETTWRIGVNAEAGPFFLASLLDLDITRPDRSTQLSLDELIRAVELKKRVIDEQLESEALRMRQEYLRARVRHQQAVAQLAAVQEEIDTYSEQWASAMRVDTRRVAADRVTPYLHIQRLQERYGRHLTEAWAATQEMGLYTEGGQRRIQQATQAHYVQVLERVHPSEEVTPAVIPHPAAPSASAKPAVRTRRSVLGMIIPSFLTIVGTMLPALASAQTAASQAGHTVAGVVGQVATGGPANAVVQAAFDVTLGEYTQGSPRGTLSYLATHVLRALKPDHVGKFSPAEITETVHRIARENNIPVSEIDQIQPDQVFHLDSFGAGVQNHLAAEPGTGFTVTPHATAPSVPTPAPAPAPDAAPAPAPASAAPAAPAADVPVETAAPAHASTHSDTQAPQADVSLTDYLPSWDSITSGLHHTWAWIFQSPDHILLATVGLFAGIALITTVIHVLTTHKNGNPYTSFMPRKPAVYQLWDVAKLRMPTLIGLFALMNYSWGLPIGFSWSTLASLLPWLKPIAALIISAYVMGRNPTQRHHRVVKWVLPATGALSVAWLVPATGVLLPGIAFAVSLFAFTRLVSGNSAASFNGLYRLIRSHRWGPLAVLTSLLIFMPGIYQQGINPLKNWVQGRVETIASVNTLGSNFGVGVRPLRLPVEWSAPETGVVTAVRGGVERIAAGQWVVVYEPMDDAMQNRLHKSRQTLEALLGNGLLSEARIQSAGQSYPDALIRLRADFDDSVDKRIADGLDQLEEALGYLRVEQARSLQMAEATGEKTISFKQEQLGHDARRLARELNALLLERQNRNLRAVKSAHLFQGSGLISVGTDVRRGAETPLFIQEFPDRRLLQISLTPADALGLERLWQTSERSTHLQLLTESGRSVTIPLTDIVEIVRENNAALKTTADRLTAPQILFDQTFPIHLIVKVNPETWDRETGPYQFTGVFKEGERFLEKPTGVVMGRVQLLVDNPAQLPQNRYRLPSLRERAQVLQEQITRYQTLQKAIAAHQRENEERDWAPTATVEIDAQIQVLISEREQILAEISLIERSGVSAAPGRLEPVEPSLYESYPLARDHGLIREAGALLPLKGLVRVQVSFYAERAGLLPGHQVTVRTPAASVPFQIRPGQTSLDPRSGWYLYQAEALMRPEVARTLFAPGRPMTEALVEVDYGRSSAETPPVAPAAPAQPTPVKISSMWGLHDWSLAGVFWILTSVVGAVFSIRNGRKETSHARAASGRYVRPTRLMLSPEEAEAEIQQANGTGFGQPFVTMDESELESLYKDMLTTALEEERYWYRGQPTTYLTWWQLLTHGFRSKIKLANRMVLLRRFKPDGLKPWSAWLMDRTRYLRTNREIAGSKTTTMLFVWPWLGGILGALAFGNADLVLEITRFFTSNPGLLAVVGMGVSSIYVSIFVGFIIFALIVTLAEGAGKFAATGPYNITLAFLKVVRGVFRYDVEERFVHLRERFERIATTQILARGSDEYEEFTAGFQKFARLIAQRAHQTLSGDRFDQPSNDAVAFENAFRIQVRRSQTHPSPIYPGVAIELRADDDHLELLRHRFPDFDQLSSLEQYNHLLYARIEEAKGLMLQYPVHTLMALLRAGTTELTADISEMPEQGLVRDLLKEIKDRTHTLDENVFDGTRAQDRFEELFDLLHYVFEGLRDTISGQAPQAVLKQIRDYWYPGVIAEEHPTWNRFWQALPRLLKRSGKDDSQIRRDDATVRMVAYALTLRRLKEDVAGSLKLLQELKGRKPHPPETTMAQKYLRNEDGQPTTSVLEMNMVCLKYFDLMTQLVGRFPDAAILGQRDIYLTFENAVPRQLPRELELWLKLTRGHVYIVDVGASNPNYARYIDDILPERITPANADRVHVVGLEQVRGKLARDRQAIIFSSATPLDWLILKHSVGELYHVPSELLGTAAAILAIRDVAGKEFEKLITSTRASLEAQYQELESRQRPLRTELEQSWPEYDSVTNRFAASYRHVYGSLHQKLQEIRQFIRWRLEGRRLMNRQQPELQRLEHQMETIAQQLDELNDLEREVQNVSHFLSRIQIQTDVFPADHEAKGHALPVVDDKEILTGRYRLDVLFRREAWPASKNPKSNTPLAGVAEDQQPLGEEPSIPRQPRSAPHQRSLRASA